MAKKDDDEGKKWKRGRRLKRTSHKKGRWEAAMVGETICMFIYRQSGSRQYPVDMLMRLMQLLSAVSRCAVDVSVTVAVVGAAGGGEAGGPACCCFAVACWCFVGMRSYYEGAFDAVDTARASFELQLVGIAKVAGAGVGGV